MRIRGSAFLACATVLLVLTSPATALDLGEWVPGLKLSPFFSEQIEYESNVFQVPSHAQGSVIIHEIPGFIADYTFGPHTLSAGGRADILNYLSLPAQNTVNYMGVTQLRLEYPRLLVNVRDDVVRTTEPPNSELTGPIASFTNTLKSQAEYRLTDRFSLGASAGWLHVFYPDDQAVGQDLNRNEYLVTGSVFWHFSPKADLGLNANFDREVFTDSSDRNVTNYGMTLSLRGELTAKLSSTFSVGFVDRIPDTGSQPGYFGVVMSGGFTYKPTERTTIVLLAERVPQESTFDNTPFYVSTGGSLSVSQQITSKLTATARVGGGVSNYPQKQETVSSQFEWRRDTFYGFGIGASYAIQPWLSVGVNYYHTGRNSNFDQNNFKDDKISGRVTVQF